jgi:hypothetical protein
MQHDDFIAAASRGEGDAEHASERTSMVRERTRAGGNARIGGRRR